MTITIRHYDGLNRTPALEIAMEGHLQMMRSGMAGDTLMLGGQDRAIVAYLGDPVIGAEPVGVMTWYHDHSWKELSIILGYVRHQMRNQGVATALWNALVDKARELGVSRISSSTRMINAPMRALAAKQGRREVSVNLEFDVPELEAA